MESFIRYYKITEMENIEELCFEIAKKIIENSRDMSNFARESWPKEKNFKIYEYEINIKITDEDSKINVNKILEKGNKINSLLLDIFKNLFIIKSYPLELIDCFLDWIDEDNIPREKGAEEFEYRMLGYSYSPPNRNLLYLKELLLIKGFNKRLLYGDEKERGILDFITIYSDGKININTCSEELLNSFGFTYEQVKTIVEERKIKPIEENFLIRINREVFLKYKSIIKYRSNFFRIMIKVNDDRNNETYKEGIAKKEKNIEIIKKGVI